jgi:small ligand-binding sensory domain FIST
MVMDPFNDDPKMGDFLIRNIVGADRNKNIISVGAFLREGQIVQFHLRDSKASSDELSSLLANANLPNIRVDECGALIFSCLGRGKYLFGKPDHDTGMFKQQIGDIPLTGFFAMGR